MLQSTSCRSGRCINKSGGVFCVCPSSFVCCVSLCDADHICPLYILLGAFFWPSQGQWCFFFSAKWYNLAAIFIAESRLQKPVIHACFHAGQVHIMHRLFVLLILMSLNNTFISLNRTEMPSSSSGL